MVSIPPHLKSPTQIDTYLGLRHDLADKLVAFRRAYPRSRRFAPPNHWRIWAERDDDDDVFDEGWCLDETVVDWLDANSPGWGSACDLEGRIYTFHLGFEVVEHMHAFIKHWSRRLPPVLLGKLGFEPEPYMTLKQFDALLAYIGNLEDELEILRGTADAPPASPVPPVNHPESN